MCLNEGCCNDSRVDAHIVEHRPEVCGLDGLQMPGGAHGQVVSLILQTLHSQVNNVSISR